jgi:hypothetical protein
VRQGAHHVAQKFTRTTLPRKSANLNVFPLMSFNDKFGAFCCAHASVTPHTINNSKQNFRNSRIVKTDT